MKKVLAILVIVALVGAGYFLFVGPGYEESRENNEKKASFVQEVSADLAAKEADAQSGGLSGEDETVVDTEGESEEELTEEEKKEREEEKLVDEFDAETDKWMDAEKTTPPTMDQIRAFHEKFKKLPKNRKDECLHRALNLIPDENVMLLVGILMDKSEDKEFVELIYNDVLNRDEEVKKPILQTIFKDKEHPCWADTAWILDVTGELPKKN